MGEEVTVSVSLRMFPYPVGGAGRIGLQEGKTPSVGNGDLVRGH